MVTYRPQDLPSLDGYRRMDQLYDCPGRHRWKLRRFKDQCQSPKCNCTVGVQNIQYIMTLYTLKPVSVAGTILFAGALMYVSDSRLHWEVYKRGLVLSDVKLAARIHRASVIEL